ncbi:hypothetical protein KEM52_006408, partial [Ascosphaera acerosa]
MDVTQSSFNSVLPRILNDIAEADFVAIDLEFSGIADQKSRIPQIEAFKAQHGGRSLQARYREIKLAAEKFTVLQLGLTTIREDPDQPGSWRLRPYNINANPLVDSSLGVEREWSFSNRSLAFLLRHGFQFDQVLTQGVRYLSRKEVQDILSRPGEQENRAITVDDIEHRELAASDLAFLNEVRHMISDWLQTEGDYLNIPPPLIPEDKRDVMPEVLTSFQKRLVHQTVRACYPGLASAGMSTFVQITPRDDARAQLVRDNRRVAAERRIIEHTGLRWLIEALAGGDLSGLRFVDDDRGDGEAALTEDDLQSLKTAELHLSA